MRLFNKKGVSAIVAVVLVILMTVAAAGIIAGLIIPFVRNGLDESSECLDIGKYYTFERNIDFAGDSYDYNCKLNNQYGFSIRANDIKETASDKVKGFKMVWYGFEGDSEAIEINEGFSLEGINELDKEGSLSIPKEGEVKTYVRSTEKVFKKIEVYPILNNGRLCEEHDEIEFVSCKENIIF